jgi:ADP-ribose pyrophosphatase
MDNRDEKQKRNVLAEGKYLRMVAYNGWEWVERINCTGIVVIVALTDAREVLFVEQYRKPMGANIIEFPAGLVGDSEQHRGESLEKAALRELLEETGYKAEKLTFLTEGPPSAGLSNEIITFFAALKVERIGIGEGDGTEEITLHTVPLRNAYEWLEEKRRSSVLADPKVYGGLYLLEKLLKPAGDR